MKAWWVYQLWGDLHWEPLHNKHYLLGKATRGGPQANEGLMGIPVLARPLLGTLMLMNYFFWVCHWWQGSTGSPESCLACLLAHSVSSSSSWPLHLVSLLFYDSKICKERQKIWYNWCSIIELFSILAKNGVRTRSLSATGDCTTANDVILQIVPIPKVTLLWRHDKTKQNTAVGSRRRSAPW